MGIKLGKSYRMREAEADRRSEETDKSDFYVFRQLFDCKGYFLPRFLHLSRLQEPYVSAFEQPFSRQKAEWILNTRERDPTTSAKLWLKN